jgi:hypothetical protein
MIFETIYSTKSGAFDSIKYQLRENEIVEAWVDCLRNGNKDINQGFYGIKDVDVEASSKTVINAYNAIKHKLLAEHQIEVYDTIDQDALNKLHAVYHYYQDRYTEFDLNDTQSLAYLQDLNREIHQLESCTTDTTGFMVIINPVQTYEGIDIKESWYKEYFGECHQHGDLMLGYATVGKELFEIFNTNDVDNLDHISPQTKIYGEFRQFFLSYKKEDFGIEHLKDWCDKNGKTNLTNAELYSFRPKLGSIDTDLSFEQLKYKFHTFDKFVDWELR